MITIKRKEVDFNLVQILTGINQKLFRHPLCASDAMSSYMKIAQGEEESVVQYLGQKHI